MDIYLIAAGACVVLFLLRWMAGGKRNKPAVTDLPGALSDAPRRSRVQVDPALAQEYLETEFEAFIAKKLERAGRGGSQGARRAVQEDDSDEVELPN